MRVTSSMFYQDTIRNNNNLNSELYNVTNRISSGIDIRYAQEDVVKFASTMQLDNEITTLTQAKNSTQSGFKFSAQTDTALGDISKLLDQFKVKLTAAATDGNSDASMDAIAKELRGIEETMTNVFNTSIGGEFIFSGTALDKRPISDTKEYMGNDGDLKTFSGSNVQQVYNVSGEKLFFGDENGTQRNISTNIPLFNQTLLHPNIMKDETIPDNMGEEKYINVEDTIRDMMGDSDTVIDTTTAQHHFYIQGKRSDGESFKDIISMRDDESVESLLNKIGESYGNSVNQDVVNVTMNKWGQIEVQDKLSGSSQIDFNMIANTGTKVTDLNELFATGNSIKEFINSDFTSTPALSKTATVQDFYNQKLYTLPVNFNQVNGVDAKNTDLIQNFLKDADGTPIDRIDMNFKVTKSDGTTNTLNGINLTVDSTTTFKDLEDSIKTQFASAGLDTDVSIQIQDGVMKISDITSRASDPKTNNEISFDLTTHNTTLGTNVASMHTPSSASQDNSYFDNSGAFVTSNVPQIVRDGNTIATKTTKLSEVATGARLPAPNSNLADLTDTNLKLEGKTINGEQYNITLDLDRSSNDYQVVGTIGGTAITGFDILDSKSQPTSPNDITYQQLFNVLSTINSNEQPTHILGTSDGVALANKDLVINGVDIGTTAAGDATSKVAAINYKTNQTGVSAYVNKAGEIELVPYKNDTGVIDFTGSQNIDRIDSTNTIDTLAGYPKISSTNSYHYQQGIASNEVGVSFNKNGEIELKDQINSTTNMQLSLYDESYNDYSITTGSNMTFQNNNAITINDPKTDFYGTLEEIIKSVEEGKMRSNGTQTDPRNGGIENALSMLDDLYEHISRQQTQAGVQSQAIQGTIERTDLLIVSTSALRSSVIDTDIAEASLQLNQLSLNLQAMLSSVGKVAKLSLVNYL